jgi:uncharacterized protein
MALLSAVGRGGASRTALAATALLAAIAFAALTALAFAQADGPDYFRITGLKKEDRVNVRRGPDAEAKIVGKIPKDTDGIKNLGCKGGLTQKQWAKASEAKKKAAAKERWCQVEHDGVKGWVSGRFLGEGTAPQAQAKPEEQAPPAQQAQPPAAPAVKTSFDCAKAEKNWEKLTCADNELAAIDREAARLYQLASDAMNARPGFEQLLDSQGKWRGQLATCFDRECVSEMLVRRVHQLRRDFRDTRAQDASGISMGPLLARCEGFPQPVAVTFVNSDPGFVYLEWMGGVVVMPHAPSGSAALYEGSFARLHVKADEALLLVPGGKGEMRCKLEPGG